MVSGEQETRLGMQHVAQSKPDKQSSRALAYPCALGTPLAQVMDGVGVLGSLGCAEGARLDELTASWVL